jgi:transposase-like protein
MGRKPRKVYPLEVKRKAVEEYISGTKSASQLAVDLNVYPRLIYKWREEIQKIDHNTRFQELSNEGRNPDDIKRIMELETEIDEYVKKLAEQMLINLSSELNVRFFRKGPSRPLSFTS